MEAALEVRRQMRTLEQMNSEYVCGGSDRGQSLDRRCHQRLPQTCAWMRTMEFVTNVDGGENYARITELTVCLAEFVVGMGI